MSTAPRPLLGGIVRPGQNSRLIRDPQRLLTSHPFSSRGQVVPFRSSVVFDRKRAIPKEEQSPHVLKHHKFLVEDAPTKTREAVTYSYNEAMTSNYGSDRSFDYGMEDDDYEVSCDRLPPRLNNFSSPPIAHRSSHGSSVSPNKMPVSITNMGKAVVTGRREVLSQPIDVQQLIEKYVSAETSKESEAWLVNIGLCEKLNSMTRDMEEMRNEMSELKNLITDKRPEVKKRSNISRVISTPRSLPVKKEITIDRFRMPSPMVWSDDQMEEGSSLSTPFGFNPAPPPLNEGDYVIPPIYTEKAVDCRDVYTSMQHPLKRRPGDSFLTHYIRRLFPIVIDPPYRSMLTIRSRSRNDSMEQMSEEFIKPIQDFFLAVCDVPIGQTKFMKTVIREALAHELREIRRNPRKKKSESLKENERTTIVSERGGGDEGIGKQDKNSSLYSEERMEETAGEEEEEEEEEGNADYLEMAKEEEEEHD